MKTLILLSTLFLAACATTPHKPTRAERSAKAEALFRQLDVNHDGYISRAELYNGLKFAGAPDLNPNLVMGLDTAKKKNEVKASRKLTQSEIDRTMKQAFSNDDQNLDQRLSKEEFKKLVVERPADEGDDPWEPFME